MYSCRRPANTMRNRNFLDWINCFVISRSLLYSLPPVALWCAIQRWRLVVLQRMSKPNPETHIKKILVLGFPLFQFNNQTVP